MPPLRRPMRREIKHKSTHPFAEIVNLHTYLGIRCLSRTVNQTFLKLRAKREGAVHSETTNFQLHERKGTGYCPMTELSAMYDLVDRLNAQFRV